LAEGRAAYKQRGQFRARPRDALYAHSGSHFRLLSQIEQVLLG
jgi:hypothetical protein